MTKIRLLWPRKTQVLIFGELGVSFLRKAVPKQYTTEVLPLRDGLPVAARGSFLIRFLINCVRQKLSFRQAYFSALIDEFKPRAIVTFVDNNSI